MPCRTLKAQYVRKGGVQFWVVNCPYCLGRHWLGAGPYTQNPLAALKVLKLPCGSSVELASDIGSYKRIKKLFNDEKNNQ